MAVLQKIDTVIPEQVIAVPKISYDSTPQRVVDRRRPQEAEQLVEVPTIVSFSSLLPNAEQIVVTPGVGCRGGWGGLQGLPAGQSSTAFSGAHHFPAATAEQIIDIPVPRRGSGGIQGFHPKQNPTALPEQIVEFPVLGGLHGFTPGQGFPALLDAPSEHFHGFSRTFESAASATSPSPIVPASGSSWTRAAYDQDEVFFMDDAGREWIKTSERTWVDVHGQQSWLLVERRGEAPYWWNLDTQHTQWLPPWES